MSLLPRAHKVISRRQLLLSIACGALLPRTVLASLDLADIKADKGTDKAGAKNVNWADFRTQMAALAKEKTRGAIRQQRVVNSGLKMLEQLDIHSTEFNHAVAQSYETGNRYWLWQRLIKQHSINGGILTIDSDQLVALHDHPGAIGMVRIISGAAEVWQFDEIRRHPTDKKPDTTELVRVARNVLRPGDTAVLTPDKGNIHALRSVTKECRMLDFFIPPYDISQRSWFEPLAENWFDKNRIFCRKISHNLYSKA